MHLHMVGVSHKTADVDVREAIAIAPAQQEQACRQLRTYEGIRGAVVLSTCNRTEIYVDVDDDSSAHDLVCAFIADFKQVDRSVFERHLFEREGIQVVHHLFSVVSSLDSMVLGEQQIIGQTRNAFKNSVQAGSCSMILERLFRQALSCGKRVRKETGISESHVSLSTVAIDVARSEFDTFDDKQVLVVGSGEMSELSARYLRDLGVHSFVVISRTFSHARALAEHLGGSAEPYEKLPDLLKTADIVISSTAAPHCIILPDMLEGCKNHLLILDIAVPRDVDPACATMSGVTLYDLDDLGQIIERNQEQRRQAAAAVQEIVQEETQLFASWINEHAVTPTIKRMRQQAEDVRSREVERLVRSLSIELEDKDRAAVDAATRAIVKKLLHTPTVRMKQSASVYSDFECVEAVRFLYGYSDDIAGRFTAPVEMNKEVSDD